jgi:hypothetical protein
MNTPILLLTFNRPDHVRRVLSVIREQRPRALYVFQDGAREDVPEDSEKCRKVREVVSEVVDWECDLHTQYADRNHGCGAGPMTGISWFFSQVEEGIVMEDDCLPHPDFFGYCEELLERYRKAPEVRFINSTLYDDRWSCEASYGFSHYMVTGAWAGWKRTWEGFDLDLKDLDAKMFRKHVLRLTGNRGEANWWYAIVREIQQDDRKKSYWDFQMQIRLFRDSALTIHPKVNLISNIGFDAEGTHTITNDDLRGYRPIYPILPLAHPQNMMIDNEKDARCWAKSHSQGWWKDQLNYWYNSLLWSNGIGHRLLMVYKGMKGVGVNTHKV